MKDSTLRSLRGFLKIDDIKGESTRSIDKATPILMNGVRADAIELSVQGGPLSVTMQQIRGGDLTFKTSGSLTLHADGVRATSLQASAEDGLGTGSQVVLHDVLLSGDLSLLLGEGDDEVTLQAIRVRGTTNIEMGGGDDSLRVFTSRFGDSSILDGGPGTDVLRIVDTVFAGQPELNGWEERM